MLDLLSVQDYIRETVDILSVATGMEVIICDTDCLVLGDSAQEDWDIRDDKTKLSSNSIVRKAIEENRIIIMKDSKRENPPCQTCQNANSCLISSIIAYPILEGNELIGGIGLYATTKESRFLLLNQQEILIDFVQRICDMFIGKVREQRDRITFQSMNEQLQLLIESMDNAIAGFDEENKIINANSKFYKLFSFSPENEENFPAQLKDQNLQSFITTCFKERIPKKAVLTLNKQDTIVSYKPVLVDQAYRGALLYFKKSNEVYKEVNALRTSYSDITFKEIVGSSDKMTALKAAAQQFAESPSTIFLQGKSGTGKEMFARAIHNASLVSRGPFVVVNCAAIPDNLLESELFGHKEGAFTGSMKGGKKGKFEAANKGTLFLDEVGEMPLHLQPKLLRAIQEKRIQPVGSNDFVPVDIRIIAATNQNMEELVKSGAFREDLYYRLNVIPLYLPELKERQTDIAELIHVFLDKYNALLDKNIAGFDQKSQQLLCRYNWPGNIRELQNAIEYAVNACNEKYITAENLPQKLLYDDLHPLVVSGNIQPLADIEAFYIREALRVYGSTSAGKNQAAAALGISRATLYRKLKDLDIEE